MRQWDVLVALAVALVVATAVLVAVKVVVLAVLEVVTVPQKVEHTSKQALRNVVKSHMGW